MIRNILAIWRWLTRPAYCPNPDCVQYQGSKSCILCRNCTEDQAFIGP